MALTTTAALGAQGLAGASSNGSASGEVERDQQAMTKVMTQARSKGFGTKIDLTRREPKKQLVEATCWCTMKVNVG